MKRKTIAIAVIAAIIVLIAVLFIKANFSKPVTQASVQQMPPVAVQQMPQPTQGETQTQETQTTPPADHTETQQKKEVVLVKGIILDFKVAGNDPQDIHRKSLAQKVVPAMSWRNHVVKEGMPMEGFYTYMKIEREGDYVFKVIKTDSSYEDIYVTLLVDGVREYVVLKDTDKKTLEFPVHFTAGVHEIRLFVSYNSRNSLPNFKVKFGLKGAERDLDNHALPHLYQLYYDKNELTSPAESLEKVYKFDDERKGEK
jgi:hypothetical protein